MEPRILHSLRKVIHQHKPHFLYVHFLFSSRHEFKNNCDEILVYWTTLGIQDWLPFATQPQISDLHQISAFVTTNKNFKRAKEHRNSPLWCKQLLGRPPVHERDQNLRLCTPGCCWWGCYEQPDPDGRNPYPTGTSCQMRSLEACPPAGSLWTGHHASGKHWKCHFRDCSHSFLYRFFHKYLGSSSNEEFVSQALWFKCHVWNHAALPISWGKGTDLQFR